MTKRNTVFRDGWGNIRVGWIISGVLAGVLAFSAAILGIVLFFTATLGVHYGKVNCNKFAQASGYPTKFVRNSVWSWDCYAQINNHWLPIGRVRGNH